ncbi:hypothetical protein [Bradyrhizobium sp.]|uniref:hypothetical protein n=1 Tax=Bradyrhizobium sp. TaxID=376 RepID=UPI0023A62E4C|nr:hypothetical protein [Bradyrhizobium sp.]MDE1933488.1 hypothetical protein [Bradyrhizobium sp.]
MIGAIDGAVIGQMVAGQIGGKSIELWQSGCMCPSTHSQMHSAVALPPLIARKRRAHNITQIRRLIAISRPVFCSRHGAASVTRLLPLRHGGNELLSRKMPASSFAAIDALVMWIRYSLLSVPQSLKANVIAVIRCSARLATVRSAADDVAR